jgi:hypothetical protein
MRSMAEPLFSPSAAHGSCMGREGAPIHTVAPSSTPGRAKSRGLAMGGGLASHPYRCARFHSWQSKNLRQPRL